jgi:hypothetical protein
MAIDTSPVPRSRRALLAGALGGLAATVAAALGRPGPTVAAIGSPLIIGSETNNAENANTQLLTNSNVVAFKLLQTGPGTALMGYATPAFGATRGVYGRTDSPDGYGVQARNAGAGGGGAAVQAIGGSNLGVDASTADGNGYAVKATNTGVAGDGAAIYAISSWQYGVYAYSGATLGVYGITGAGGASGVFGDASTSGRGVSGRSGSGTGVEGVSYGAAGHGVVGAITSNSITAAGVYGESAGNESYAGYFVGHVGVTGVIENAAGLFKIDHPLDPANRVLQHSAVQSADMKNVYDGVVILDERGAAAVELPGYVAALNRDFRYQLTALEAAMPGLHVARELGGGRFTIAGGAPGGRVCWQLTGIRRDAWANAHRPAVEVDKQGERRGRYLHPLEHDQPESKGVDYPVQQRLAAGRQSMPPMPSAG